MKFQIFDLSIRKLNDKSRLNDYERIASTILRCEGDIDTRL